MDDTENPQDYRLVIRQHEIFKGYAEAMDAFRKAVEDAKNENLNNHR